MNNPLVMCVLGLKMMCDIVGLGTIDWDKSIHNDQSAWMQVDNRCDAIRYKWERM